MKPLSSQRLFTPSLLIMAVLIAAIVLVSFKGVKVPVISDIHASIFIVLILGLAMCLQGVGRVSDTEQVLHPLALLSGPLGALIVIIAFSGFFDWNLFSIQTGQQALLVMAILIAVKVVITVIHALLSHS